MNIVDKKSFIENVIMSRSVQQGSNDVFLFRTLWQDHCVRFLAFRSIQVYDFNCDLQIIQQRHYRYLVCFLVDGFNLQLAEQLNRDLIVNKRFIQNRIVSYFPRCNESQKQNQVVGLLWIPEHLNNVLKVFGEFFVESVDEHLLQIFEDEAFKFGLQEVIFGVFDSFEHALLEFMIFIDYYFLKYSKVKGSIEAASISSGFAVEVEIVCQVLDFHVEALVRYEFVHEGGKVEKFANKGGLLLDLFEDDLLLLFLQNALFLEFVGIQLFGLLLGLGFFLVGLLLIGVFLFFLWVHVDRQFKDILNECATIQTTIIQNIYLFFISIPSPFYYIHLEAATSMTDQKFISIEGNIGSGKSSILHIIRSAFPLLTVLDQPLTSWEKAGINQNVNLLQLYYQDPQRWGFTFQIYAFMSRLMKWREFKKLTDMKMKISERSLLSDRYIFASIMKDMNILSQAEYLMYLDCYENLIKMNKIAEIKGIIYIRCEPNICNERIRKRGREGESSIPLNYLERIHEKHEEWLNPKEEQEKGNILIIDNSLPLDKERIEREVSAWLEKLQS